MKAGLGPLLWSTLVNREMLATALFGFSIVLLFFSHTTCHNLPARATFLSY